MKWHWVRSYDCVKGKYFYTVHNRNDVHQTDVEAAYFESLQDAKEMVRILNESEATK